MIFHDEYPSCIQVIPKIILKCRESHSWYSFPSGNTTEFTEVTFAKAMWRRTGQTSASSSGLHRWGCRRPKSPSSGRCPNKAQTWRLAPAGQVSGFSWIFIWFFDWNLYIKSKGSLFRRSAATWTELPSTSFFQKSMRPGEVILSAMIFDVLPMPCSGWVWWFGNNHAANLWQVAFPIADDLPIVAKSPIESALLLTQIIALNSNRFLATLLWVRPRWNHEPAKILNSPC